MDPVERLERNARVLGRLAGAAEVALTWDPEVEHAAMRYWQIRREQEALACSLRSARSARGSGSERTRAPGGGSGAGT